MRPTIDAMRSSITRRPARHGCLRLAILIVSAVTTTNARAQMSANAENRLEAQQLRLDAALGAGPGPFTSARGYFAADVGPGSGPSLGLALLGPINYNSNAPTAPGGPSSLELNPDFRFTVKASLETWLTFKGYLDNNYDRFTQVHGSNVNNLKMSARFQASDPNDDQGFQPFVQINPAASFDTEYKAATSKSAQLALGFDKAWNLDLVTDPKTHGQSLAPFDAAIDTASHAYVSFGLTAYVARTFATTGSYAISLNPSVTWNITNVPNASIVDSHYNLTASLNISEKFKDPKAGFREHDLQVQPTITLEWDPPQTWFGASGLAEDNHIQAYKAVGAPKFLLQAAYAKADSNKPGVGYNQWVVGPVIKGGWQF